MAQLTDESPMHFYKYKGVSNLDYSCRIFTDNELYFSKIDDFNDPFDCRYRYELDGSEADLIEYHDKIQREHHPSRNEQERRLETDQWLEDIKTPGYKEEIQQDLIEKTRKWGIYCLSAVRDDILMWAHYANGHRGFCLEFLNEPSDQFYAKRKPNDPDFLSHPCLLPIEVKYSDEYPVIDPLSEDYTDDWTMVTKGFRTKATQWQYEKEWRLLDDNGPGPHQFPSRFLTGVIFGCEMSEDHKEMIREWCKDRQPVTKYYEARRAADAYALKIVPA